MTLTLSPPRMRVLTPPLRRQPFSRHTIAGLECWLDFADAKTITLGTGISQIRDKSGFNRHASQPTAARQPAWNSTQINGRPVASFTGSSNHYLEFSTNTLGRCSLDPITGEAWSLFIVSRSNSGAEGSIISKNNGLANTNFRFYYSGAVNSIATYLRGTVTAHYPDPRGTSIVTRHIFNGTNALFSINGNDSTAVPIGTAPLQDTPILLGARWNAFIDNTLTFYFTGTIAEIIAFGRALSIPEQQFIEGYLAWKWGTVSALPSTHPYKSIPLYL